MQQQQHFADTFHLIIRLALMLQSVAYQQGGTVGGGQPAMQGLCRC